jgi:ATP-dependent Clp protease ATP-binding subunit ClpC
MREKVLEEAKRVFKPEFLNRISDIIFFRPLDKNDLIKIVELETKHFAKRLAERKITLEFTPSRRTCSSRRATTRKYGARPLRRAVEHYLEDPLAEAMLRGEVKDGEPILVDRNGDKLAQGGRPSRGRSTPPWFSGFMLSEPGSISAALCDWIERRFYTTVT